MNSRIKKDFGIHVTLDVKINEARDIHSMHTEIPISFQNNEIVELIDLKELASLRPTSLIQAKQRLKGYCNDRHKDPFLSYLTAGEYYPVEPSVFTSIFWQTVIKWVSEKLGYSESELITCRCQFNAIPENAYYHPLSISPHADSLNHNYNIAAINIPIQSTQQFSTAFWSHSLYGSFLGEFNHSLDETSLDIKNHPFHARDLLKILDDNLNYVDHDNLKLENWSLRKITCTPTNTATLYDGRNFHSPYLITKKTNVLTSRWEVRWSLAIFVVYRSIIPHIKSSTDTNSDKELLYTRIIDSMKKINGNLVPYRHE